VHPRDTGCAGCATRRQHRCKPDHPEKADEDHPGARRGDLEGTEVHSCDSPDNEHENYTKRDYEEGGAVTSENKEEADDGNDPPHPNEPMNECHQLGIRPNPLRDYAKFSRDGTPCRNCDSVIPNRA
jgi:hypothetical protein